MEKLQDGVFYNGINYWASHASLKMWQQWDGERVEKDFQLLSLAGIKVLRVFPLWSDFQPLKALLTWGGGIKAIRYSDAYSMQDGEEENRLDEKCVGEFAQLCDLAKKYNFKLIVPLITGYMSGQCFFPEAFIGKNVITDPLCIKWEVKYVQSFVERFKNREEIIAWELGNECNCMGEIENPYQAWLWTNSIVSAVKAKDTSRPVISGMHGLCVGDAWRLEDQADVCDILTVHPYHLFTAHCSTDGLVSSRAILHSVAEQTMYADLGGKPCLIEEIGSLGDIYGDEQTVADFLRANLWNGWACNGLGLLWWTAFDQDFGYAPYEWVDCERELGIFTKEYRPKRLVEEFVKFNQFLQDFPYKKMPKRVRNAACLVKSDAWTNAFGAYMLAKRAGIELQFADSAKSLPEQDLYILPAVDGVEFMPRTRLKELIAKIEKGATVLMTYAGGTIAEFEKLTGCYSKGRKKMGALHVEVDGQTLCIPREFSLQLERNTAEVLLTDDKGNPALTCNRLGKGQVLFFNAPLENFFATTAGICDGETAYEKIYSIALEKSGVKQIVKKQNANVQFTLHPLEDGYLVVAINNTAKDIAESFAFENYQIETVYYGEVDKNTQKALLKGSDAVVFSIKEKP